MAEGEGRYLKMVATVKHSSAYSLEAWCEDGPSKPESVAGRQHVGGTDDPLGSGCFNRGTFDAVIPTRDLVEYYWPPWRAVIEGADVHSIMCSHNSVNGFTSCDNGPFNNGVLRDKFGFNGYMVSDCGAFGDILARTGDGEPSVLPGRRATNLSPAAAFGLRGGVDLECPDSESQIFKKHLPAALAEGLVTMEEIDTSLERILAPAFALGLFEPEETPWASLHPSTHMDTPASRNV